MYFTRETTRVSNCEGMYVEDRARLGGRHIDSNITSPITRQRCAPAELLVANDILTQPLCNSTHNLISCNFVGKLSHYAVYLLYTRAKWLYVSVNKVIDTRSNYSVIDGDIQFKHG